MDNEIRCYLKAMNKNVRLARNIAQIFFTQIDTSISFLNEIKTIVSEAVTNAIIHGCQMDENMEVEMHLSFDQDFIYIEIIDHGIGIKDIELAKTPMYTTKPEDDRSGLGFTIMEVFSDELILDSKEGVGTTLKIIKKRIPCA